MYTRMLIPLDGSKVAEQVLPYARFLAKALKIPVELLEVVDLEALRLFAKPELGRYIDTLLSEKMDAGKSYLQLVAQSFQGAQVTSVVEKGTAENVLIEHAARDKDTLIVMATHGRSGIQRWLLGSVAEKVLHGARNHLMLVRATDGGQTDGEASLKTVIAPLDGSPLAEQALPHVVEFAKKMQLKVVLIRAYALPPAVSAEEYGYYSAEMLDHLESDARDYLAEKVIEVKRKGIENVSSVISVGYGAEEIITLGRRTPDNFIAMSTHGRSGIQRWVLGSVTDRVVRHSGDPVLIVRSA